MRAPELSGDDIPRHLLSHQTTIAVIDDDEGIREALEGLLHALGFRVRLFKSGEAFLRASDDEAPACLIVDMMMPGLTGLQLQAALNALGEHPPIIFLTSYFDEPTRQRALAGGAADFLGKPVNDEVLISSIHSALSGPPARCPDPRRRGG